MSRLSLVLTKFKSKSAHPKAIQSSFQTQIESFSKQQIRDDEYYASTAVPIQVRASVASQVIFEDSVQLCLPLIEIVLSICHNVELIACCPLNSEFCDSDLE